MENLIVSETSEHAAILSPRTKNVAVFRKAADGTLVPIGAGRWEDGIVRGSGVNCGILVLLEPSLRAQAGTP